MADYRDKTLSFESKLQQLYDELESVVGDPSLGNQIERFTRLARDACPQKLSWLLMGAQSETGEGFFETLNKLLMRKEEDWFAYEPKEEKKPKLPSFTAGF